MGLYYRLDYKNNKNRLNQKDSVPVIIDYYYKGKRTKVSTGVSVANQKLDIEGEHPAPFPEKIITLPILQTSKEFELVLDPFMGSGTTGRVCDKLGRSFVDYDLKEFSYSTLNE